MAAIRTPSKSSALFLSADIALIEQMARELRPTIIHLGASTELLRPEHVIDLRKMLPNLLFMRSVPVTGPGSIATARSYDGIVDFLLLDSHREGDPQLARWVLLMTGISAGRLSNPFGRRLFWPADLAPTTSLTRSSPSNRQESIPKHGQTWATPTPRT